MAPDYRRFSAIIRLMSKFPCVLLDFIRGTSVKSFRAGSDIGRYRCYHFLIRSHRLAQARSSVCVTRSRTPTLTIVSLNLSPFPVGCPGLSSQGKTFAGAPRSVPAPWRILRSGFCPLALPRRAARFGEFELGVSQEQVPFPPFPSRARVPPAPSSSELYPRDSS